MSVGTAIAVGGLAASAYGAYKTGKAGDEAADQQKQLMDRQSALAGEMTSLGKGQISTSKPALDAAMRYYTTLATGNRGAVNNVLAPERAGIADTQRGSEHQILAKMAPGAQRDQAMADLVRRGQGQMGLMPIAARTDAMGKLAGMGQQGVSNASSLFSSAAGALGGQSAGINSMYELGQKGPQAWGQFGGQLYNTYGKPLMQGWNPFAPKQQAAMGSRVPAYEG